MKQTITEEQKQLLQNTKMTNGMNAWDYVLSQREEERPWLIDGSLLILLILCAVRCTDAGNDNGKTCVWTMSFELF